MKEIKIVSRWDSEKVLVCGKYESIKDCLEENKGAYLGGAYLRGAYLRGANLRGAYLRGAYLRGAYLRGASLEDADLGGADLGGANLGGADLRGASLGGADLGGANLEDANLGGASLGGANLGGADLGGAKNYYDSHDFAKELIKRIDSFTDKEWSFIGKLIVKPLCWEDIRKDKSALSVCKKLAKEGFDEYLKKYREL